MRPASQSVSPATDGLQRGTAACRPAASIDASSPLRASAGAACTARDTVRVGSGRDTN